MDASSKMETQDGNDVRDQNKYFFVPMDEMIDDDVVVVEDEESDSGDDVDEEKQIERFFIHGMIHEADMSFPGYIGDKIKQTGFLNNKLFLRIGEGVYWGFSDESSETSLVYFYNKKLKMYEMVDKCRKRVQLERTYKEKIANNATEDKKSEEWFLLFNGIEFVQKSL